MTGKTERVILVKGGATKWYEQAIFIVNPNAPAEAMPIDFVAEAEKIIHEYNLTRENRKTSPLIIAAPPKPVKNDKTNFAIGFLMAIACLTIAAIFAFGVLN